MQDGCIEKRHRVGACLRVVAEQPVEHLAGFGRRAVRMTEPCPVRLLEYRLRVEHPGHLAGRDLKRRNRNRASGLNQRGFADR